MTDRVKNAVVNLGLQIGWIEGNDNHKFPGWKNVTDAMKEAQALLKEQEAVVRCKDCKYGAPTIINGVWLSVTCGDVDHRPEWFCADGERRDDG